MALTAKQKYEILFLVDRGMAYSEVAEKLSIKRNQVAGIVDRNKNKSRQKKLDWPAIDYPKGAFPVIHK